MTVILCNGVVEHRKEKLDSIGVKIDMNFLPVALQVDIVVSTVPPGISCRSRKESTLHHEYGVMVRSLLYDVEKCSKNLNK